MRSKAVPDLPKLIFGQIAYLVVLANESHIFCLPEIISNHKKSAKRAINAGAPKKRRLPESTFGNFG